MRKTLKGKNKIVRIERVFKLRSRLGNFQRISENCQVSIEHYNVHVAVGPIYH